MAESVDALVSNTSGATHPGSIPGLGTKRKSRDAFPLLLYILLAKIMVRQWRTVGAPQTTIQQLQHKTTDNRSAQHSCIAIFNHRYSSHFGLCGRKSTNL